MKLHVLQQQVGVYALGQRRSLGFRDVGYLIPEKPTLLPAGFRV